MVRNVSPWVVDDVVHVPGVIILLRGIGHAGSVLPLSMCVCMYVCVCVCVHVNFSTRLIDGYRLNDDRVKQLPPGYTEGCFNG